MPLKDERMLGRHPLREAWESGMRQKITDVLKSLEVQWTFLDPAKIGIDDLWFPVQLLVWIGVQPGTLSGNDGAVVVSKCVEIVKEYGLDDVEVEICEHIVTSTSWGSLFTRN